jgi:hypothetical protein
MLPLLAGNVPAAAQLCDVPAKARLAGFQSLGHSLLKHERPTTVTGQVLDEIE